MTHLFYIGKKKDGSESLLPLPDTAELKNMYVERNGDKTFILDNCTPVNVYYYQVMDVKTKEVKDRFIEADQAQFVPVNSQLIKVFKTINKKTNKAFYHKNVFPAPVYVIKYNDKDGNERTKLIPETETVNYYVTLTVNEKGQSILKPTGIAG